MAVDDEKQELRLKAKASRLVWAAEAGPEAGEKLAANYAKAAEGFPEHSPVIAGYWPMADEINVRPLLGQLHDQGRTLALPVVVAAGKSLVFRRWQPGMVLEEGSFGTQHPGSDEPQETPGCLLVPLLAFDSGGYRLGWGAGFYDRTLAGLREAGPVIAVGIAFHAQQVDRVPETPKDGQLDWIVTDQAVLGPMQQ